MTRLAGAGRAGGRKALLGAVVVMALVVAGALVPLLVLDSSVGFDDWPKPPKAHHVSSARLETRTSPPADVTRHATRRSLHVLAGRNARRDHRHKR